jgi:hypothetical protein
VSGLRAAAAAAARKPDTQPSTPHHTDNLKTKAPNTTGSNHLYNTLELLMMAICSIPQTGHTTLSSTPYRQPENQAPKNTGGNQLYNTLELLMMGIKVPPKHVEQAVRSAIKIICCV